MQDAFRLNLVSIKNALASYIKGVVSHASARTPHARGFSTKGHDCRAKCVLQRRESSQTTRFHPNSAEEPRVESYSERAGWNSRNSNRAKQVALETRDSEPLRRNNHVPDVENFCESNVLAFVLCTDSACGMHGTFPGYPDGNTQCDQYACTGGDARIHRSH